MNRPIPGSLKLPDWIKENVPKELCESTLFRFEVMLQVEERNTEGKKTRKQIIIDLIPVLDLDYECLEQQMQSLPSEYAFFATVYSEVRQNTELMERALKARKGNIIKQLVMEGKENGIKFNADQIKIIMEADEGLIKVDTQLQKLQMQTGKLYHLLEALKMKAELARSLAGFKRQEQNQST